MKMKLQRVNGEIIMCKRAYELLCASALVSLLLGMPIVANAADMAVKAPPPPAPPPFSWTGFYIGANIGGAWSQRNWTDSEFGASFSPSNNGSFIGGGQFGANYEINNFVLGLEGDFDGVANNNNSVGVVVNAIPLQVSANSSRWIATLAGRIGYAPDRWLLYFKGGGAWVGSSGFTVTDLATGAAVNVSGNNTNSGWLVGGGVEYAFANNWSVRAEYNFIGLNNRSFTLPVAVGPLAAGDVFTTHNRDVQSFTVGINYLFNWGSSAVASRY
jgi:outer membrane immunogenic protein